MPSAWIQCFQNNHKKLKKYYLHFKKKIVNFLSRAEPELPEGEPSQGFIFGEPSLSIKQVSRA